MKKLFTALTLVIIICVALSVVACDGNKTVEGESYKVTVTCSDSITLATVKVKLVNLDGTDATEFTALTNGSVEFKIKEGTYKVVLSGLLDKFDVPDKTLTALVKETRIDLTLKSETAVKESIDCIFNVLGIDKKPISGIQVQVCNTVAVGAVCVVDTTDSGGVARLTLKEGEYTVHVLNVPDGAFFEEINITVSADKKEFTLNLESATEHTVKVMYDDGSPLSGAVINFIMAYSTRKLIVEATADQKGMVVVYLPEGLYSVKLKENLSDYSYQETYTDVETPKVTLTLVKRGTTSSSRIILLENRQTTISVESSDQEVWLEFITTKAGVYSIQSSGDLDASCIHYHGACGFILDSAIIKCPVNKQDLSDDDKNFYMEFRIEPYEIGEGTDNIFAFKVGANVEGLSVFGVEVKFISAIEQHELSLTIVHSEQIKDSINAPEGAEVKWVEYGKGHTAVYSELDGYYHLDSTDGAIIMVAVSGKSYIPRGLDVDFCEAYKNSGGIGFILTDGETYRKEYGEFIKEYGEAANSDGLTPLTPELKEFLQNYALLNGVYSLLEWDLSLERNNAFLFACCYYA